MGDIIKGLKSDEEIRSFSKNCLQYCSDVAKTVREYGGVTIYSGGDDLLALIPVENGNGETVFDFIRSVNKIFADAFSEYNVAVSLSFGVFVSYHKFPLYEALEKSAGLLFGTAKTYRDCTAIHFQKHAGQSEGLVIANDSLDSFIDLHKKITDGKAADKSEIILSAMHKLTRFEKMFNHAATPEIIQNLFDNTFDADAHKGNEFLKTVLPVFFSDLKTKLHIYPITNDDPEKSNKAYDASKLFVLNKNENLTKTMNYILRVIKFFTEGGGEAS